METENTKLLLIEDNPGDIRLCRELLNDGSPARWEIQEAHSLAAGVEHLDAEKFDLIALDLSLPDSQGLETYNAVAKEAPQTPIVILTGRDDPDLAVQVVSEGAQDYLFKDQLTPYMINRAFRYAVERYQLKQSLEKLSTTDDLSGLLNRRGFFQMAEHQILVSHRSLDPLILFFIDIDGLKVINDRYGHKKGDLAITATAEVLRCAFRESDLLARLGGDEFAALAVGAEAEDQILISERIQQMVDQVALEWELPFPYSLSVGSAVWDIHETQKLEQLIHKADRAMYAHKDQRTAARKTEIVTEENFQEQPPFISEGMDLLLVEDNPGDARLIQEYLRDSDRDFRITHLTRLGEVTDQFGQTNFSVILLDLALPDSHGINTLLAVLHLYPETPVVVFTGRDDSELAAKILQAGAQDYLVKGQFSEIVLERSLGYAVERSNLWQQNQAFLQEIQRSEQILQSIFDHVQLGIFRTDTRGRIHFANRALVDLLGYDSLSDLLDVDIFKDHFPGDSYIFDKNLAGTVSGKITEIHNLKDQKIPIRLGLTTTRLEGRKFIQGTVENISRQRKSEDQIRLQATALNAAANAIMITNAEGRILWINEAFTDLTGYPEEEILGKDPRLLKSGKQTDNFYQELWEAISSGRVWQGEIINRRKNGSHYAERMTITPLQNDQGQISHYIAVKEDISVFKTTQQVLQRRLAEITTLSKVAAAGIEETDEDALIERVTGIISDVFYPDHFGVLLLNSEQQKLTVHSSYRGVDPKWVGENFPLESGVTGYVARTGKSLVLEDTREEALYLAADQDLRSEICVPLTADGQVLGVLNAESKSPGAFDQEDVRLLTTFAGQLATAISRIRTTEQEREQRQIAETLSQVAVALNSTLDINRVLDQFLDSIAALIPYESASLVLYLEGRAQVLRHRGYDEKGLGEWIENFEFDQYASAEKEILQGKHELVRDAWEEDNWINVPETEWVRSYLGVPILRESEVIGIINLDHSSPNFFQEKHIPVVKTLANQVATALENAELYRQQKRQVDFLESLRQIDFAITGSMDLKVTLEVIMMEVVKELEVDAVDILLYDPESYLLTPTAQRGFQSLSSRESSYHLGEGLAGQVVKTRTPQTVPDLREYPAVLPREVLFTKEGFQSYYGLPLIAKGRIVGVMELFRYTPLTLDPEWVHYVETVGTQTAIAVDNSQLFSELQQANRELSLAYDTTLEGWAGALELRDHETEGHSRRVVDLTMQLVKAMKFPKSEWIYVRRGALLHDIGKMGVPDQILQKPGKLSEEEWELMRKHPLYAEKWLKPISYLKPSLDIPLYHHERWDGTGYPFGLQGTEIPLAARIFAVVDVWDALRSDRPYRQAWTYQKTLDYIRDESGQHFDPHVVDVFLDLISETIPESA